MAKAENCPWWKRGYHRRKRKMDRELCSMLIQKDPLKAPAAWDEFIHMPGQEHWHCPCAKLEEGSDGDM